MNILENQNLIVVLEDGETYSGIEGCTVQIISDEQREDIEGGGDADDIEGEPIATYSISALIDMLLQAESVLATGELDYSWGTGGAA